MNKIETNNTIVSVKNKRDSLNVKLSIKLFEMLFVLFLLVGASNTVLANNLVISNVSLTGRNVESSYTLVQFDISWDNSWRINDGPSNWDAAWVFVKYRKKSQTTWHHATLNWVNGTGSGDGHTVPANSNILSSNDNGSGGTYGVFIHRNADMVQGSVNYTGVQLQWNYGVDGLTDGENVEVCVSGIEMVYVPASKFYVGSGGTEIDAFYKYPTSTNPFQILSEDAITVGTTVDNLYYPATGGDQTGPIPAAFPKGYKGFYSMKYEITQEQYVNFLNKLTRGQQDARTATSVASGTSSVSSTYVMAASSTLTYRNGIRCDASIHISNPIKFYCDLNGNGTESESDDGQNIACNYLSWADVIAYLDWSALRPMTELEYEKLSRGNQAPLVNEYAWGIASASAASGISNSGSNNETASNAGANCAYNNTAGVKGPMRSGCFGQAVNTRAGVGAGYYGIMELSGNLWERTVSVGSSTGRAFTGTHGDGVLNSSGDANVSQWPGTDAVGSGFRGGNWLNGTNYLRASDRYAASNATISRYQAYGGRGVRVAP